MSPLPNMETYPKTILLRDGTRVELRPLEEGDKIPLLHFFGRIPEDDRYYLKENVTAPEVIHEWTTNIDFERVIPIIAVADGQVVADATLHRSRAPARYHIGELRVVVDPGYREKGLGRRLMREMLDIAAELGMHKVTLELVARRERPALMAADSVGFQQVAVLNDWVRDMWGNYQDMVILELPVEEHLKWWRY